MSSGTPWRRPRSWPRRSRRAPRRLRRPRSWPQPSHRGGRVAAAGSSSPRFRVSARPVRASPRRWEALVFFRLSSLELGLVLVAVVFGTTALGLVLGHYLRPPVGASPRAVRRPAGRAARAGRARSGLRSRAGGGSLRVPSGRRRRGCQCHRHDVPPRSDAGGTDPNAVAQAPGSLHGHEHPPFELGAYHHRGATAIADGEKLQRELWALAGQALADAPERARRGCTSRLSTR